MKVGFFIKIGWHKGRMFSYTLVSSVFINYYSVLGRLPPLINFGLVVCNSGFSDFLVAFLWL